MSARNFKSGPDQPAHKPLPAALESEKAILCAILNKPEILMECRLSPDDFHHPGCKTIYRALHQLRDDGTKIDLVTLNQLMADWNLLEQVGARFLADIFTMEGVLVSSWVEYEKTVQEKSIFRKSIKTLEDGLARCYDNQFETPGEILSDVGERLKQLQVAPKDDTLPSRRFDLLAPPAKPIPSLFLSGHGVCTAGNVTQIVGQAKTAKSSLVAAIVANGIDGGEHLGIHGSGNTQSKALVHFDTEQSPYDHHQLIVRSLDRACVSTPPEWLRSYTLADVPTAERRRLLAQELEAASKAHGGIYQAIIDGVADLCGDPNDPLEAFGLVEELHRLAITFDCSILAVLHLNPGSDFKTRGHLGSQLERKAESTLALEREKGGDTITLWMPPSRHGHVSNDNAPRFAWDIETGRHELIEGTNKESKTAKAFEANLHLARLALAGGSLGYGDLVQRIMSLKSLKDSGAKTRITQMIKDKIIIQNILLEWELAPSGV